MRTPGLALAVILACAGFARPPTTRLEFARAIATIRPGDTAARVRAVLGPPSDIRTEHDPGGIAATDTMEIWRWGTSGHLTFATLGAIHMRADGTVQYVFGGRGTPPAGAGEPELRRLLGLLDAVTSYNDVLEPQALIAAVNALQPLGKDRALAVVDEYLRVSSRFDDRSGREGVFLVMRALFDVPPGGMPGMAVGGATDMPTDPRALPRFPLVLVDDVPLKLVRGYELGGEAEPPEDDVAAFRKVGTLRTRPLAPSPRALEAIDAYVAGPLASAMRVDDVLRTYLYDQALRLVRTAYLPADANPDTLFPFGGAVTERWKQRWAEVAAFGMRWDVVGSRFTRKDGTTLTIQATHYQRVWWDLSLPHTTTSRVTFERKSDALVDVELHLELTSGSLAPDTVRLVEANTGKLLGELQHPGLGSQGGFTSFVTTSRIALPRGVMVRPELASGLRGADLTP